MEDLPIATSELKHGTKCLCTTCLYKGTWDDMKAGKAEFKDAVWINGHYNSIECHVCWLK